MEPQMTGDEIVISGIAGKFPNSDNVKELQKNLLNKVDCTTDSKARWDFDHPQVPPRIGVMRNIDKFDNLYFGIHGKLTNSMDPMMKMIMETTYEAIIDAGINPKKLKGSKSAVFTGSSFSESEKGFFFEKLEQNGLGIVGALRAMLSNRISFFFDLRGPSMNIDSSCCGGATALQEGYKAIKEGRAENAIIGATSVILHPQMSIQLFLSGLLSPDGVTKSFDNAADGYTRSESIVVFFLQKARDAKRIYAEVKNVNMSYGNVNNNLSFLYPTYDFQANLMKMTLKECNLVGKDISFIEADGSGIKDVDAEEVKAIDQVFNDGRKSPLLIGSVKSNLGSCSSANPLIGIIKVITAMELGYIPPNLNFKKASDKIPALEEGRCKVVTKLTPWIGDFAVINSFGLTGSSANVILKNYNKNKRNGGRPNDDLPRLVICSGCTEEAIDVILTDVESRPVDVEMLQLLYDIFETETQAHLYRGYTMLPSRGLPKIKKRETQYNSGFERKVCYMFSGMGSQWVGMGEALLHIPIFAEAISKCDRVLKPRGYDIVRIITEQDPQMFDNIVNSFIGIAAIQIGLVDLLNSIGLKPDLLIGHSVGELGCAYADECFTAEQMILSALSRGLASVESDLIRGSMAAVGLGFEEIKTLCPPDIDVACHNSANSSTISGPVDSMKKFVAQLTANTIFAKEVACSNIAYHSRYIAPAGEKLRKYLQEVIPNPKPRSSRWLSSSVPRHEWNSAKARLSSAEYHTNNLLNSVLFAETAKNIPKNAIVIEIAPHGLLQAIVRKSFPETVVNVPLTKRGHPDNVSFLFEALGKLYVAGCNINVSNLYPKVCYPVSRGTPSISSLIRWDHSNNWYTSFFKKPNEFKEGEMCFIINLKEEQWRYLKDVMIDEKIVVPTSLYLTLAWKVLICSRNCSKNSVVYQDVRIHKHQIIIPEDGQIALVVMLQKGSGYFEVTNNETLLCSGILQATDTPHQECSQFTKETDKNYLYLTECDVYTELQMRGLQYSVSFKTIRKLSANGCNGTLAWRDNWTTFLEGMIQMCVLGNDVRGVQVPIKIRKIIINFNLQEKIINMSNEIPATVNKEMNIMSAGGIQMEEVVFATIVHESGKNNVVTGKLQIIPTTDGGSSNLSDILDMTLQILNKNSEAANEIFITDDKTLKVKAIIDLLYSIVEDTAQTSRFKINEMTFSSLLKHKVQASNIALLILCNTEQKTLQDILNLISDESFLLTFTETENECLVLQMAKSGGLGVVLKKYSSKRQVALLFRRKREIGKTRILDIDDGQDWSNQIKTKLNSEDCDRLIIAIRSKKYPNLCKNVEALQSDQNGKKIQIVDILDTTVLEFSLDDSTYKSHMNLGLKMNILLPDKIWGMYKHFPLCSNLRYVSNWTARQLNASDLGSICWIEGLPEKSENTIKVEYSGVNESDIHSAKTKLTFEDSGRNRHQIKSFGQEYSGIDSKDNRVMGISSNGAFSNIISTDTDYMWTVPDNWSLEDAATVPLAYTVAYLALIIKGELKEKQSVFIYNSVSSTGQAAINLALNIKSQLIVGHDNDRDKMFLKTNCKTIVEKQIISTTGVFADQLLVLTEAKGVDLAIYNTDDLSKLETCLKGVRTSGKIIIIGNLPQAFDKSMGMRPFRREIALFSIMPSKVISLDLVTKRKLSEMINEGITTKVVQPLCRRVYSREMLKNAFIDGASKKVVEKIIVKVQPDDESNKSLALPRFVCKTKGFYLIIEGLSDFGLELIDFLVDRGARNILIISESKNTRAYSSHRISLWRGYGVSVVVRDELDLSQKENVNSLLEEINTLGTVDAIFDLQRISKSRKSVNLKYQFTKHLIEESKQMFPEMRRFVIFATFNDNRESVDDVLLREIDLTAICQEKSNEIFPVLLIIMGPTSGIVESITECERKVPLLTIPRIIEQLDNLIDLKSSIISILHKSSEVDLEKVENEIITTEESERSKFDKYIYNRDSLNAPVFKYPDSSMNSS